MVWRCMRSIGADMLKTPTGLPSTMATYRLQPTVASVRPARRACTARASHVPPPVQQQGASSSLVSRSQVLKGALLAATAVALPQPASAVAAEVASEAATAAAAAGAAGAVGDNLSKVVLRTLGDCQLAVSVYPTFDYNAAGGGGVGTVAREGNLLRVVFDPASLQIPAIQYSTTAILGVPIPPPLKIEILPRKLEGTVDPATGVAELEFLADFAFTAAPFYTASPLVVSTTLTTEASEGAFRKGQGMRLGGDGRARLVGVARVPRTEDTFLNTFLMLPTDALAVLSAEIQFS